MINVLLGLLAKSEAAKTAFFMSTGTFQAKILNSSRTLSENVAVGLSKLHSARLE